MTRHLASIAAAALLAAAACGRPAEPASDLVQDLQAASGPSIELAPRSAGTQIVSDLEQTGRAPTHAPAVAPKRTSPAPKRAAPVVVASAPEVAPAPTPEPAPERVETPAPKPIPAPEPVIATPRPSPAPRGTPARRGGYSSVSDVIRNAPFPITP